MQTKPERLVYTGASDEQVNWGGCDDPRLVLTEGNTYTLKTCDVHSWHTKIELEEAPGLFFNSVSFKEVE